MKRPRLIVITGIDGSGKTTIARLLTKQLRSEDIKTRYVWIKSLHTLAYLLSRVFVRTLICTSNIFTNNWHK